MVNKNPIMSVDFTTGYSTLSDEVTKIGRVCINLDAIQTGLVKHIGVRRFGLLMAIVSYMDNNGRAFPSQRKLAELTGVSKNTVNKMINELLEVEVDGQKVLRRELLGKGSRKKSMYYIHAGGVTNTEDIQTPDEKEKRMNSRDIALYFSDVYKDTFNNGYVVNWGRDLSMIKNKLIPAYEDDETLTAVIDIAVKEYRQKWANDNYPLPTIPMVCTWLANRAYGEYKKRNEKAEKQKERIETAQQQDDTDRALDNIF